MKVRLQNQSMRLRLGRSEVAQLGRGERVESTTVFAPGAALSVALLPAAAVSRITVDHEAGGVVVRLPAAATADWACSDQVGLSADVAAGGGLSLRVLIEKDFQCLDRPADAPGEADAFPNPAKACR